MAAIETLTGAFNVFLGALSRLKVPISLRWHLCSGAGTRDFTLGNDDDRRLFALINQNLSLVELRSGNWIAAAQGVGP